MEWKHVDLLCEVVRAIWHYVSLVGCRFFESITELYAMWDEAEKRET